MAELSNSEIVSLAAAAMGGDESARQKLIAAGHKAGDLGDLYRTLSAAYGAMSELEERAHYAKLALKEGIR